VKLKEVLAKNAIGWRSFWNGEKGPSGPIAQARCVRGWPIIYLIDHKGVIRKRYAGAPEKTKLDPEIERLMAEAEGPAHDRGRAAGQAGAPAERRLRRTGRVRLGDRDQSDRSPNLTDDRPGGGLV
jgi:hypothetical protein